MIQAILLILKIIGIALLVLLALVFLALALVLFVPVCYRVRVVHNPEQTRVTGRVSFLFPLFAVSFEYLKKFSYKVKIFFFAVLDSEKPKKEKKPKKEQKRKKKKEKSKKKQTKPAEEKQPGQASEPNTVGQEENSTPVGSVAMSGDSPDVAKEEKREDSCKEKESPKSSPGFFKKISLKLKKIRETISNLVAKIKKLLHQKDELLRILGKPESKQAIGFVWEKVKHLFRHILPRKVKGYLHYGAADPATTGKVTGIISVLYARTGYLLEFRPNFEKEELACDVELKGHIQVFTLLLIAIKVFLNKELRQLIQEVKHIKYVE